MKKRELARRLVDRFAGEGEGRRTEQGFDRVHVRRELPPDMQTLELDRGEDQVHLPAVIAAGFDVSSSEARRLLAQGGVRLDGDPVPPDRIDVPVAELAGKVLQVGKRRFERLL